MSYKVRRVALDFIHPVGEDGYYKSLYMKPYSEALKEHEEEKDRWNNDESWRNSTMKMFDAETFDDYSGGAPDASEYFPEWTSDTPMAYRLYDASGDDMAAPISAPIVSYIEFTEWLKTWFVTRAVEEAMKGLDDKVRRLMFDTVSKEEA